MGRKWDASPALCGLNTPIDQHAEPCVYRYQAGRTPVAWMPSPGSRTMQWPVRFRTAQILYENWKRPAIAGGTLLRSVDLQLELARCLGRDKPKMNVRRQNRIELE